MKIEISFEARWTRPGARSSKPKKKKENDEKNTEKNTMIKFNRYGL